MGLYRFATWGSWGHPRGLSSTTCSLVPSDSRGFLLKCGFEVQTSLGVHEGEREVRGNAGPHDWDHEWNDDWDAAPAERDR